MLPGKHMAKYYIHIMESLPGVLGNRGNDIYSRGTGNKGQILSVTGYKGNIGEHGTLEKQFWILGEQGNKPIYFRGTREQFSP